MQDNYFMKVFQVADMGTTVRLDSQILQVNGKYYLRKLNKSGRPFTKTMKISAKGPISGYANLKLKGTPE